MRNQQLKLQYQKPYEETTISSDVRGFWSRLCTTDAGVERPGRESGKS
jgi:hypothetical protein